MNRHLGIGELAKETGVKVVTIRYYEQVGILPEPSRTTGNYRTYTVEHVDRLRFVRRCRDLGFSLDQIKDLFRLSSEDLSSCKEVCQLAERHIEEIEEKIADLKRLASELRQISSSCSGKRRMAECRILEALSRA
jgi:Cd(II)/Pb(II)-responsive transcriptional regulator